MDQFEGRTMRAAKICLLLGGIFFSCLFFTTLTLHNDHVQILLKAFKLIDTGEWSHFGNAGTGVGFVPGSFLTAITAVPMQIYFSPYSAMAVILLFHLVSLVLFSKVLKENFAPIIIVDFLLLYWLSPWRVEQSELYNPAYLFLFSALHFYTSYYMTKKSFWLTFFHTLAVGFCAQVHYSVLMLAVLSLALFYFRYLKVNWWGFIAGCAVFVASLIPYAIQYVQHKDLAVTLNKDSHTFFGHNLLLVYPVLKGVTYWIRYGAISYGRHIFSEINFLWIQEGLLRTVIHYTFHGLKWILSVVTILWSVKIQWQIFSKIWKKDHPFRGGIDRTNITGKDRIYAYAFYLFFAMLVAVGLSPVELNHWHLILCFPVITIMMTIAFSELRQKLSSKRFHAVFATVLVSFCLFDFFAAMGSRTHSFRSNFHRDVMQLYKEYQLDPANKTNQDYRVWHHYDENNALIQNKDSSEGAE
jgi:hypothetical protein